VTAAAGFATTIRDAYAIDGPAIVLGRGVHDGAVSHEAVVQIPLAMMNRHGLVAGATGTGETKTLQLLAEQLSAAGVPVFVADVKGDASGVPTPVVHTRMVAPRSRMAPADDVAALAAASPLREKYATRLERESAREVLAVRMERAGEPEAGAPGGPAEPAPMEHVPVPRRRRAPAPKRSGGGEAIGDFLTSRQGKALQRQVLRGVFGMLRKRL
jgi:hypothetical protein